MTVDRQAIGNVLGESMASWDVLAAALESNNAITADEFSDVALAVADLRARLAADG